MQILAAAASILALVAVSVSYVVATESDRPSHAQGPPRPAETLVTPSGQAQTDEPPTILPPVTMTAKPPTPTPTPTPTPEPPPPPPVLDFTITSFNMLGSSHTSGRGKSPGMASGRTRAGHAARILARHRSDVVGFQEMQRDQLAAMRRHTDMTFFPGFKGSARDSENSIGWRSDVWQAVETRTITIPYFNGNSRQMPYVKLRSRSTGLEAWFANFHNPANTPRFRRQEHWRERATSIEISLAKRLMNNTGLPVFVTGDMNDRAPYFCRMTGEADMVAARGGSNDGACRAGHPRAVDWIFGSEGVVFSGYFEDRSHLVDITTDHPVITSRVRITASD